MHMYDRTCSLSTESKSQNVITRLKHPSTPPQKMGSNFASQGQELEHEDEDEPPSEVKCEACGWKTAEINAPNEGTPTRERRCASCKARQLKYSGSPAKQAHKGGSH